MASCSRVEEAAGSTSVRWGQSIVSIRDVRADPSLQPEQPPARVCAQGLLQPLAGHHRASWVPSVSASPSGRSPKQAATLQGSCRQTTWLIKRAQHSSGLPVPVPKADVSPPPKTSPSLYQLLPLQHEIPSPNSCTAGGRITPMPGRQGNSTFLFLPEAQELYCPPADQGSPSQLPHCLASSCKSSADCSAPRCGW